MLDIERLPPERWGWDHASNLLYIESRCVDAGGVVSPAQLNRAEEGAPPSRLKFGPTIEGHDDWCCLADMEAAGLLQNHGGVRFTMTDRGWRIAGLLRRARSNSDDWRASDGGFDWVEAFEG